MRNRNHKFILIVYIEHLHLLASRDPKIRSQPFWCTAGAQVLYPKVQRSTMTSAILSSYCQKPPSEARSCYIEKLQLISGLDPFCPSSLGKQSSILSPVDTSDIVLHFVLQTSFATAKQFKAYKSMEAYNQFFCGWVKDV